MSHWLARFSTDLPPHLFQMVLNLGGITATALALTGLSRCIIEPDAIMRGLKEDYLKTLNHVNTAAEVESYFNRYAKECASQLGPGSFSAAKEPFGNNVNDMLNVLAGVAGPAGDGKLDGVAVCLTDLNVITGTTIIHVDSNS